MLIGYIVLFHQIFVSSYYAGRDLSPMFRGGEPWKTVFGPVYIIYVNSAPVEDEPFSNLWEDAKKQVWSGTKIKTSHINIKNSIYL